ncbi:hypothetical protein FSP39_001586 [Pinctada imbricata]|uniref:SAM-dependent MTase RsmB/NOP-type domain-containing protein n=1 Tax=Pinctada imbricata TaxID=66713 RepID=A0AA88YLB6_PINIB|nr:hypothetical protein FSP39_001586 [Pinctada imbricata]
MSPTAETLIPQRRPVSSRCKTNSVLTTGQKPYVRTSASLTEHAVNEKARMRMKMSEEDALAQSEFDIRSQFFRKEPCLYSHQTYLNAGKIFTQLKHETIEERDSPYLKRKNQELLSQKVKEIPQLVFRDDQDKRRAFELAFTTLKYQSLFEEILQDCAFYSLYPEHMEDSGLVMVILCDYQGRKFQLRTPFPNETLDQVAQQVEEAITECKTRLNAALARHRIKAEAPSLDHLLPESVRSKEEIRCSAPVYAWVNQKRASISEVIESLKDEGFRLVSSDDRREGRSFCADTLCNDVLMFPPDCRENLINSQLVLTGKMVLQDKSSSLAPHSVKYLVGEDTDVIHVNCGSGMTTAHFVSVMEDWGGHVFAFGAKNNMSFIQNMDRLGIKGVKAMNDNFLDVEADDHRFKNVRVILVTADCSKSGVTNPIDFIVNEGEDMKILKDLSTGETDLTKLGELTANHLNILKHALRFNKVQAVVYTTRSMYEAENENVVQKAIEYVNMVQQRKFPYRVVPPVLPFTSEAIDRKIGIHGKFIKFQPSDRTSGCFVAVVTREPEDAKEAARDVLARAQAKGLLSGKKSRERKPQLFDEQNGEEIDTPLTNGHAVPEASKLLSKRTRKVERKIPARGTASAPNPIVVSTYTKPNASSPIHKYIHTPLKSRQNGNPRPNGVAHATRLYNAVRRNSDENINRKPKLPEHVRVVKHPAPFR